MSNAIIPVSLYRDKIRELILASPAVAALVGTRVYDEPPEKTVNPWIRVGEGMAVPDDADGYNGITAYLDIHVFSSVGGKWANTVLCDAVKAAIHQETIDIPELAVIEVNVTITRGWTDADGKTQHGVITTKAELE